MFAWLQYFLKSVKAIKYGNIRDVQNSDTTNWTSLNLFFTFCL